MISDNWQSLNLFCSLALLRSERTVMLSSPVVLTESEFDRDSQNHLPITWILTLCQIYKNNITQKLCFQTVLFYESEFTLAHAHSPVTSGFWLWTNGSLKSQVRMSQWTFCHIPKGISLTHTFNHISKYWDKTIRFYK